MPHSTRTSRPSRLAAALALGALAPTMPAMAEDWVEPRSNDAGRVKETALFPSPMQEGAPLDSISGVLEEFNEGRGVPPSPTDGQDMFAIYIENPAAFSARVVPVMGSTLLDPQLFLFDAGGLGLLGNLDFATFDVYPRLFPTAGDGTFALTTPGLYYLAVSGASSVPFSGSASAIFNFGTPTELSGPDGPGGAGVHVDWIGPMTYGSYYIELTGVRFVPAPGAGVLGAGAVLMLAHRRRRAER